MKIPYLKFFLWSCWNILTKLCSANEETSFSNLKWEHDLFSISDLHGDLDAFLKILLNEKMIDNNYNVIRENVLIVITGDVLDPSYDDINILFFIEEYNEKGKTLNSKILMVLGNHEVKNMCLEFNKVKKNAEKYQNRNDMFSKNEVIYNILVNKPFVLRVNEMVFSHAGVLPFYASYGIDYINREGKNEIENNCELLFKKRKRKEEFCISCDYGPTLNRYFSFVSDGLFKRWMVCSTLSKSLNLLSSSRMIVGHTVQKNKKVNSFCDEKLLLTDTGISKWKKGVVSYVQYFKDGTFDVRYV
ncbi:shewanella-like protein phosphatase 2, putative [Plasmodium knowlesi strain H]|uniref:Shewanella-like protein phosphatase 2, putative n=3 Tax=Plasmodium knowlesi TaxID=5850 RepID=A0A5K1UFL1_PLAKH|nr:shewanella-like protein phosphatase 2, putative [Plasmodium knowlesi strain H]OTN66822.1 putative Phosphoesterase [Plasmodium knowlesi]CAA9990097.1 shewanella-like protein phosphatase 2, putative [Plasmodium knowlesi strain H]SBO25768.1 shewanella-like protein phosphatase 2, putative [Plasmodium knowlesi strain H]SBO28568.1 shewanella-like protein phosphatase 2, putative [Plasmodium knowlesi strain H]VVS79571.1 shewanella-like protein phosphatase 2, putative [Plasmodium knowlesi strain H]|eukprot:XP_002260563.1 phosphoesterase, putative [Plasmodium knowlesi strain H]